MPLTATKTRSNGSRTARKDAPSGAEVHNEIEKAKSEIRQENRRESPKKQNIFTRFANWFTGLFSKKTEPNLEPEATIEGDVIAPKITDINDTLPPDITGEGEASNDSDETAVPISEILGSDSQSDESSIEGEDSETAKITVGDITFNTTEDHDYTFSNSGTINILGKATKWSAANRISITEEDGKYFGSGAISFENENLKYEGTAIILMMNSELNYTFKGGLHYTKNGINIALKNEQQSLNEFKMSEVSLLNYKFASDAVMTGDITIGKGGITGTAERNLTEEESSVFENKNNLKLNLGVDSSGNLGFSLNSPQASVVYGIRGVAEIKSEGASVIVSEDGSKVYRLPKSYTINLLNNKFVQQLTLAEKDIACGDNLAEIDAADFDLVLGGLTLGGVSMKLSLNSEKKSTVFSAKTLSSMGLSLNNLNGTIWETGVTVSADGLGTLGGIIFKGVSVNTDIEGVTTFTAQSINYGAGKLIISDIDGIFGSDSATVDSADFTLSVLQTDIKGTLGNLSWNDENSFSVGEFTFNPDNITLGTGYIINGESLSASLQNRVLNVNANGTLHIDEIQKGLLTVNSADLTLSVDLNRHGGNIGISEITGNLKISIGKLVSFDVSNLTYKEGLITLEELSADVDLSNLGVDNLGGSGKLSILNLSYMKGSPLSVGGVTLNGTTVTLNNKELVNNLTIGLIFDDESETSEEQQATAESAELALEDDTEGELSGVNISLYNTLNSKGVNITANKYTTSKGSFTFDFEAFNGEFLSSGVKVNVGAATVTSKLSEKVSQLLKISELQLSAENVSLEGGMLKVGSLSAIAATDIDVLGVKIQKAGIKIGFDDAMSITDLTLIGALSLGDKNYIAGEGSIIISNDGGIAFGDLENLAISYGCFSGSVESISREADILAFNNLSLKKQSGETGEEFEGKQDSLISKFLKRIPNIAISLETLSFKNGVPIKPSFDQISLDELQEEINITDSLSLNVGYKAGKFDLGLKGEFNVPDEGGAKVIKFPVAGFPIIPGVLSATFSLGFETMFNSTVDAHASVEKNEEAVNFNLNSLIMGKADFKFFGDAMLKASAIIVGIEGGVEFALHLDPGFKIEGNLGVVYNPTGKSFFESFALNPEGTNLDFDFKSNLKFEVNLKGGLTGLPAIFVDKETGKDNGNMLYHSWNLFSYNLGSANITASIAYDSEAKKYVFTADPHVTGPGKFANYSPEVTAEKIEEFSDNLEGLKADMIKINALMDSVRSGANPSNGSLGEIEGTLGKTLQMGKSAYSAELKQRIDDVMDNSRENAVKCHALMTDLREVINKSAEKLVKNERNVEQLNKVVSDSRAALDIIGYGEDKGEMTRDKYVLFIGKMAMLLENDEKIRELALLDPAAVVNMFKAFKLKTSEDWDTIHQESSDMTKEKKPEESQKEEYQPEINSRFYGNAMSALTKIMQNKESEIKKHEDAVSSAEKKTSEAQEQKKKIEEAITVLNSKGSKKRLEKKQGELKAAEEKIARCEEAHQKALDGLETLKFELNNTADISTSMLGFQNFITAEQKETAQNVKTLRQKYGVGSESKVPNESDLIKREENVRSIIRNLIKSATNESLETNFTNTILHPNRAADSSDRYSSRLKTIQDESGIVDKSMKSYGLTGFNNQRSFESMKRDSEKFKMAESQLESVYKQLTEFHSVMTEALKNWEIVNGIDYTSFKSISDFASNTQTAVELIDEVEKAQSKKIDDAYYDKVAKETKEILSNVKGKQSA